MIDRPPFSYRDDPNVPEFSDGGPRTVMDAQCSLCARGAAWIARNDRNAEFRIIPVQSELGKALLHHYGLDPADPSSWLYIEDGRAFQSLQAVTQAAKRLGGAWHLVRVFGVLPVAAQDYLYGVVARNRYRILGTTDLCATTNPEIKKRLLT